MAGELRLPDHPGKNALPLSLGLFLCIALAGCSDPVDKLITQLSSPNAATRRAAARTLGEHTPPDERIVSALSKVVADSDAQVRIAAISALAQIGPAAKSSLPVLKQALDESDVAVRRKAAFAIQRIDPNNTSFQPVLIAAMREGHGQTLLAVGAMGRTRHGPSRRSSDCLSHREAKVRSLAAHTLGRLAPRPATPKLRCNACSATPTPPSAVPHRMRSGNRQRIDGDGD